MSSMPIRAEVDTSETTVQLAPLNSQQVEGDTGETIFTFEIVRSGTGNLDTETTVDYVVEAPVITGEVDGVLTATPEDFGGEFPRGTVTFAPGEMQKVIEILVSGDTEPEMEQPNHFNVDRFTISLENASEGTVFEERVAEGSIIDDDGAAVPNPPIWRVPPRFESVDGEASQGNRFYGHDSNDEIILGQRDRAFGSGGDDRFDATTSRSNNRAYGGDGDDVFLSGHSGNNQFIGQRLGLLTQRAPALTIGQDGADTFWLGNEGVISTIANCVLDFEDGIDQIGLAGFEIGFSDLELTQEGRSAIISLFGDEIGVLANTNINDLSGEEFILS